MKDETKDRLKNMGYGFGSGKKKETKEPKKDDSATRLAKKNLSQSDEKIGPNMGGKPTKNTDTSYRMEKKEPEKKESFKEAFAKNRKAGNKTFEWNGKKYTTDLASDKKETKSGNIGSTHGTDTSGGPDYSVKKKPPVEEREIKRSPSDIRSPQEKMLQPKPFGYKKGGSITRGDGCCKRGKTKGRMY